MRERAQFPVAEVSSCKQHSLSPAAGLLKMLEPFIPDPFGDVASIHSGKIGKRNQEAGNRPEHAIYDLRVPVGAELG